LDTFNPSDSDKAKRKALSSKVGFLLSIFCYQHVTCFQKAKKKRQRLIQVNQAVLSEQDNDTDRDAGSLTDNTYPLNTVVHFLCEVDDKPPLEIAAVVRKSQRCKCVKCTCKRNNKPEHSLSIGPLHKAGKIKKVPQGHNSGVNPVSRRCSLFF
jgi:hypothetical protein